MAPERDKTADRILGVKSPENPLQSGKKPKNLAFCRFSEGLPVKHALIV
jgi:hypothetical protein